MWLLKLRFEVYTQTFTHTHTHTHSCIHSDKQDTFTHTSCIWPLCCFSKVKIHTLKEMMLWLTKSL